MATSTVFRDKLERYQAISTEQGEQAALAALFEGYPERQRRQLGAFIDGVPLAEAFGKAVPLYRQLGMDMAVVDISTDTTDAVLEIQRECPALAIAQELEMGAPCPALCELDVKATGAAFPEIRGRILARKSQGDCVCIFKYERPRGR